MPSWKKVIISGSDASLNSLVAINGVTVTGSFRVTGSTTQIGNNTLLGSTTLSGSIIISGSTTTPATPTIKIYGDMETNGVIKYMPVSKNIDTSISASYIFVSGSTNDLYFSQNSKGYANQTRLRWLEGNLYTGLLHGGLITTSSNTIFNVSSGSGVVITLNASLTDDPYPTTQFITWGNLSASIAALSASYDQSFVAIQATGSMGTIYVQGTPYDDGQYNTLIPIGNVIHQNRSTINATATYPSVAYGYKQRSNDFIKAFGPLKLSGLSTAVSGSSTGSLIVTSGTAYSDGRNYSNDPSNPSYVTDPGTTISKIYRYRQSGSAWAYDTNGGAGYLSIDPTQYSNNGVLTAVPGTGANREWSIQRVLYFPSGATKGIYVYYGNATYPTRAEAIANIPSENFIEAPNTAAGAVLSGYLIVRNNANFTDTDSYSIQQGGLFRSVGGAGGGGSTITQTLTGLSDVAISGPTNLQPLVYNSTSLKWVNASALSASLSGNADTATSASYALNAVSASSVSGIGNLISNNVNDYILTSRGADTINGEANLTFNGSTLNVLGNTIITGSLAVGTGSLGASENTITLGARDSANEGGQIGFNAPGGTWTSASFIDNWSNQIRILRGSNTTSDALVTQWNLHTKQMQLPAYTGASSFPGTATANLAVDSGGNVITVSTSGGTVFPYTGNAVITGSLTTTGIIYAQPNGGMYFQGGDDAALYDVNIVNTIGVYGVQDSTIGSIRLGSGGGTISGRSGSIGIGTTLPTSASLTVNGNVWATSYTGSLQGSSSYALTASYALNGGGGTTFPYTGSAIISGSLAVTGSLNVSGSILQNGAALAPEDGTILYYSIKWFTPSSTVSTSGTTVTSVGTQFLVGMVGSKLTINGESRIITVFTSTTQVTVDRAYSINYSGIAAGNWGVFSKGLELAAASGIPTVYSGFQSGGAPAGSVVFTYSAGYVTNDFGYKLNSNRAAFIYNTEGSNDWSINWSSTSNYSGAKDTGLRRNAAGIIEINNGVSTAGTLADRRDLLVRNITGSRIYASSSNGTVSGSTLSIYGSGSSQPVFTVQGSQGELFSVTDSLSGSLFSVNDISGLPVLEAFSDNTVLLGSYQAPALFTTYKTTLTSSGNFTLSSLSTASYDGAFYEYTAKSGSNARAGSIMAVWGNGGTISYTETATSDIGSTSGLNLGVFISGANMILTGSASTTAWTIKTIIRSI